MITRKDAIRHIKDAMSAHTDAPKISVATMEELVFVNNRVGFAISGAYLLLRSSLGRRAHTDNSVVSSTLQQVCDLHLNGHTQEHYDSLYFALRDLRHYIEKFIPEDNS